MIAQLLFPVRAPHGISQASAAGSTSRRSLPRPPKVVRLLNEEGLDVPVVIGIIPAAGVARPRAVGVAGLAGVYTPKDFDVNRIMSEIVELVGERAGAGAAA